MAVAINKVVNARFDITKTQTSIASYKKTLFITQDATIVAQAKSVFEKCGGKNGETAIKVLKIGSLETVDSALADKILTEKQAVSGSEDDFIFVCLDSSLSSDAVGNTENLKGFFTKIESFTAPNRVCVCMSLSDTVDLTTLRNYYAAVKLYTTGSNLKEVCLAIPAFYSNIQLNYANSVQDYAYTPEPDELKVQVSNYDETVKYANFVEVIGNKTVNFGGNLTKDEIAISTYFATIAAENDVVFAVLRAMLKKQYLTDAGLNNVVAVINQTMVKYVKNGFLQTNSDWTGDDYISNYTGTTLIRNGAHLSEGYHIATIPMSKITPEDRKARKFTPIVVFMQSQQGARVVEINGNIIE